MNTMTTCEAPTVPDSVTVTFQGVSVCVPPELGAKLLRQAVNGTVTLPRDPVADRAEMEACYSRMDRERADAGLIAPRLPSHNP